MIHKLTYLFSVCFCLLMYGQNEIKEFGNISIEELQMSSYEKDPEAEAVVLFDSGLSTFADTDDYSYIIHFNHHKRIKILSDKGIEHSTIEIPFYVSSKNGLKERIKDIEAYTYNLENETIVKTKVEEENIFEEEYHKKWRLKKFTFPNVKAGSIIEFKYRFESPFMFHLPDWEFQSTIPTIYSRYKVHMIPFYEYVYLAQGIKEFDYKNSEKSKNQRTWGNTFSYGQAIGYNADFNELIHTYALKDIPAFKNEAYISSKNDYIMKMNFQLSSFYNLGGKQTKIISTWSKLNSEFLENTYFGSFIKGCKKYAKSILKEEIELSENDEQNAQKLINYVKNTFEWNGNNAFKSLQKPKEFFTQKKGNSAEINFFLIALLKEADIPVQPVVLSTRKHGKIAHDYPFEHFFNYVIAFIETEKPFLADGTSPHLPYNRIPPKCYNDKGLIVNKSEVNWVNLNNTIPSWNKRQINISNIDSENLTADFTLSKIATENYAFIVKNEHKNDTLSLKKSFLKNQVESIDKIQTRFYDNFKSQYIINLKGKINIESFGNHIVISPYIDVDLDENLLKEEKRDYPVDFTFIRGEDFKINIAMPEGYKLTKTPERMVKETELAMLYSSPIVREGLITLTTRYQLKKPLYIPEEYSEIKTILDHIVKMFSEQIVFEKIE